ncbi:MAG: FliI/YscN family ATPase [Acidobacteriia bacterium]|nr:FliI/YscN family ATPase [Terriglobia bacterium]MBV8904801.1 FliI/YscN family ATPase [Terriglobia bacterium]MBV9745067.1 FliI/YscN family ATPase [Terriglobia bacterium]
MNAGISLEPYLGQLDQIPTMTWGGQITEVAGLLIESRGPNVAIGDFCEIRTGAGRTIRTQVIGFRKGRVLSMPLEEIEGLQMGDSIAARSEDARVDVGPGLMGRVIDGFGKPIDGGPAILADDSYSLAGTAGNPLDREHIKTPLITGIRAIDGLLPCGLGQRIGIFGGSGVGKSTLLGAMSRQSSADVTVIALIGERNREVRGFLEQELGPEGRKKSVVVVATSERPAPLRVRACFVALAVAEYFRDQGANVLLVMDSVTRLAMAQREIGLAAGEPPSQKGYTPSVFNMLPKILERAGNFRRGSITGFFTVLVEGDDFNEPICDAVRAILDGHIILSRELAAQGHYPAIDILHSVSRLTSQIASSGQKDAACKMREALAAYRNAEDLIQLGAYVSGANPVLDSSIQARPELLQFLRQDHAATASFNETLTRMQDLALRLGTGAAAGAARQQAVPAKTK